MGNRVSCLKGKNEASSSITLAIIGPDNAGKTTLSTVLAGEPLDPHVSPTVGFRNVKFTIKKVDVTLYDLGGGKTIRPIWKNYFSEIYGIVYMVDSSCPERLKEARDLLRDTLEHPQVSGKPLLVLANKSDVEGHMEELDILNQLDLDQTVNAHNCPSHFVMISALQSSKAKMKKVVLGGFVWLLDSIRSSMDTIESRVKEDMRAVKEMRDKEREERRERVRKQREERETQEAHERARLGITKEPESEEEDIKGDPFKLLDMNRLKMEELKAERKAAQKKSKQGTAADKLDSRDRDDLRRIKEYGNMGYSLDDTMTLPQFGKGASRFGRNANLDGLDISHNPALMSSGRSTRPSALPPLDPIGSYSAESKVNSADKKKGKKKKSAADDDPERLRNGRNEFFGRTKLSVNGSRSYSHGIHDSDNEDNEVLKRPDLSYKMSRSYAEGDTDREYLRYGRGENPLSDLDFSHHRSLSHTQAEPHDLTPRVAKPKNNRVVTAGKIEEDENEDSLNPYRNLRMSLKEYGDPRMSQKLDEYRDKYPLRSSSDTKAYQSLESKYAGVSEARVKDGKRWDRQQDREDSAYRRSLKGISPPNLDRFDDDDKDEGIEDDSESDDVKRYSRSHMKGKYGSNERGGKNEKSRRKDVNANHKHTQDSEDNEDDEDEYRSKSMLKDTLRFSRYDDDDDRDDTRRRYEKEINNLKYRRDNDYQSGYNRDHRMDSDDDRLQSRTLDHVDQRRKKKKNILKSNKLMPSDDDEDRDVPLSQRYSSPRLVKERGSRDVSDADTPSKGRNSRMTYFHSGSSRDSDVGHKWGLAEDLPTIDNDSRVRRSIRPNYDDSEGDDVVY